MLPRYAELHCRSNFSFLTGASRPGELVERASRLGYRALAITDECSVAGVVRAHEEARRCELHLIIGSEMRLTLPDDGLASTRPSPHARLVLLAQTRLGYGNLSRWITLARRRAEKGGYRAHPADLQGQVPDAPMLTGLPGCFALLVPAATQPFDEVLTHASWLKTWFGDDRAAIAIELLHRPGDDDLLDTVQRVAHATSLPIAAAGDVLMHVRSRKPLQDVLTATRSGQPVAQCGWQLEPNAEAHLRSRTRLAGLYEQAWLEQTVTIADSCTFSLTELKYEYPREIVPLGETPASHLRALTEAGALRRYPSARYPDGVPPKVQAQIEHELALIAQLEYEPYFLTVADIVRWARDQTPPILCQGRGSAANSVVCYCLGVTEVDPDRVNVLFERFISAERGEPPDIDIDFEHQRREEVIQYIYTKYGRHRAALTAVVTCYRPRSALRDVGRALGIDLQRITAVTRSHHWFDSAGVIVDRLGEHGFDPASPVTRLWVELTLQLIGFPRHLSQHPGGFVIARDDISELVPVENAAMVDRSVIQWDKDDLDAVGLLKVDILGLGMLSALRRSLDFVGQKLGRPPDRPFLMQEVPAEDASTYEMICRADTVGVFQIESRAQMSMLPRLRPEKFYDLVIEVAIVRPGPIQGGMVHPYLRRRDGLEPVVYPSDEIKQALERTLGVPIFQEQVMQIAVLAAGFTPGEADGLRRAMAAWKRKGGLGPYHDKLVDQMVAKKYSRDFAESIFKQIEGFGEYGFPESHAASFALLTYVSCWIKHHHPDAFLAALLNSQPMGFYAPAQLVRDARVHGVRVLAVDVRASDCQSTLEDPCDGAPYDMSHRALHPVRLGLDRIGGLSKPAAGRIVAARGDAPFASVDDLATRAALDSRDLRLLAEAGALHGLAGHRFQAAWQVAGIDTRPPVLLHGGGANAGATGPADPPPAMRRHADGTPGVTTLAESPRSPLSAGAARREFIDDPADAACLPTPSEAENMLADYRSIGLTLNRHPLALLRERLDAFKVQPAAVLRGYPHGRIARASGLVTHRQRPETAKGTMFVTLEDDTGFVNVVVWPAVVDAQRQPLLRATLLTVFGQWQRQEGSGRDGEQAVMHLVAVKAIDHTALLDGLVSRSRDFR